MSELSKRIVSLVLPAILIIAPLFRGGTYAPALALLEMLAVVLLLTLIWSPKPSTPRSRTDRVLWVGIAGLIVVPIIYLIPLPQSLLGSLPGYAIYQEVRDLVAAPGSAGEWLPLSLVPFETERALLTLLPPIAVFLVTLRLDAPAVWKLVHLVIGIAVLQAILGLMQYGAGAESGLYLGMIYTHFDSAVGTYTNRNHLAGFFEMVIPVTIGLLVATLGRSVASRSSRRKWRARLNFFGSGQGHKAGWYAAIGVLLLLATVFSRSRTGISLVILGVVLVTLVFSRRLGGSNIYGTTGTLIALAIGLAIAVGLVPVLDRFSSADAVVSDWRWIFFGQTIVAILQRFPLGYGPGTYQDAFAAFQPLETGTHTINRAHNDYLEWVFEAGVLAVAVLAIWLWLFVVRWGQVTRQTQWTKEHFVRIGAGIGITLLLLHELLDYNLRTPANMIFFAFWAAVFFHPRFVTEHKRQSDGGSKGGDEQRRRRTPTMATPPGTPSGEFAPPSQIKNPFLD